MEVRSRSFETGACLRSVVRNGRVPPFRVRALASREQGRISLFVRGRLRPDNREWALASQGDGLRPVVRERALASLVIAFQNRALCPRIFGVVAGGFEIRPMRIEQRIMQKTVIGAPFVTSNIFTLLRSRLVVGRDEMYRTRVKRNMFNTRSLPKHN